MLLVTITECRRVLKWTYAYGFYISKEEEVKKKFFEYVQGEAEVGLERLHLCAEQELKIYIEKEVVDAATSFEFDSFRLKLSHLTNVTCSGVSEFTKALARIVPAVTILAPKVSTKLCQDYGTVVDVYIPNRKSKAEKRFAFVRFIKVENIDRLVGNLCTLWIGRTHLHANVVRFERSPIQASRSASSARPNHIGASSFATVLKGNNTPFNASEAPAMEACGLCSSWSRSNLKRNVGVASWFTYLCNAQSDLVSRERIVWVDIEGVPLHAWSRDTFTKIGSKWGEVMDLEESKDDLFAWKRICIKTKQEDNILEKFKIIVKDDLLSSGVRSNGHMPKKGGSVLEVLDEMIKVGQTMGYTMEDMHLLDHRPILLRDVIADYGATPFRLYHSWLTLSGFEQLVIHTWNYTVLEDSNGMVRFKKKLQALKKAIREWVAVYKREKTCRRNDIKLKLSVIDKQLDQGRINDDILLSRMGLMKQLLDSNSSDALDNLQKAKIQWAIEGDENSKFFHGVINWKRANLAIRGVMVDGEWVDDPRCMKEEFCSHFATRFHDPSGIRNKINFMFPNQLSSDQAFELDKQVSTDEIRIAVWACGENKSHGPDGFTFEFFCKFWDTIGPDLCLVVEWFFDHGSFSRGCNSSFIALIPKVQDPKFVNDYRHISLIGSLYKVVTKIISLRLSSVIVGLILDVQAAFLPSRQILDGPFVINELLSWCKHKKQHAMIFKVDFVKAYDSVRWDFIDDVLQSFGFVLNGILGFLVAYPP
nr:putative RNA-directed DNA polymerase, eukaryota, reverse transcriptase zinc-binding domain protein [Tanacetum cinerariifolium]